MRNLLLVCLLTAGMLLPGSWAGAEPADAQEFRQDVNGDGTLSDDDAAGLLSFCSGLSLPDDAARYDYNYDECGTAADAAVLLRYIHGDMSRLPLPSGAYGEPDAKETEAAAKRLIRRVLAIDFTAYEERLRDIDLAVYGNIAQNQPLFSEMALDMNRAITHAAESCLPLIAFDLSDLGIDLKTLKIPQRVLEWKEAAALYRVFGSQMEDLIADTLAVDLDIGRGGGAVFSVELSLFSEMIAARTDTEQMSAKFALAYLNTVYDEAGVQKEYVKYALPEAYLSQLIHPLNNEKGQYWIKDGWYDARSRRTRLHTGTDILAPARTPIHSMTDGVVLFVGFMAIPGNYVVVRDPNGFEYHYYHMIEQSTFVEKGDFVSRGDVIGRVGNTGNSAANHLHLAIISPENTYINPYDVFLAAGITPIVAP